MGKLGKLGSLKERERTEVYCENVPGMVFITKWYNNYGDRKDIGNPEVYRLVCEMPWKNGEKRFGKHTVKDVNVPCGSDRLNCPYLAKLWDREMGKGIVLETDAPKISPELDPTTFIIEYLACRHKGKVAILGQEAIERITKFAPGKCVGNSLIKMGLAEEVIGKKNRSYKIDLENLRKYYYEHGTTEV